LSFSTASTFAFRGAPLAVRPLQYGLLVSTPQTMNMWTLQLLEPPCFNFEEVRDELIYHLFGLVL
jgi:hypothetical protein